MKKPKKIYSWYLYIAIIFATIYITTTTLSFILPEEITLIIGLFFIPIAFIYIILSIVMIIIIFAQNIEKKALLIPGIHLLTMVIGFFIGVYIALSLGIFGYPEEEIITIASNSGSVIGLIAQIAIIFISINFLKK